MKDIMNLVQILHDLKANTHDAISCTQLFSNSPICKLFLWFQHNSTKELHDTNCIVCISLNQGCQNDLAFAIIALLTNKYGFRTGILIQ